MSKHTMYGFAKNRFTGKHITPILNNLPEEWPEDVLIWCFNENKLERAQKEGVLLALQECLELISWNIEHLIPANDVHLAIVYSVCRFVQEAKPIAYGPKMRLMAERAFTNLSTCCDQIPPLFNAAVPFLSTEDFPFLLRCADEELTAEYAISNMIRLDPASSSTALGLKYVEKKIQDFGWTAINIAELKEKWEIAKQSSIGKAE